MEGFGSDDSNDHSSIVSLPYLNFKDEKVNALLKANVNTDESILFTSGLT